MPRRADENSTVDEVDNEAEYAKQMDAEIRGHARAAITLLTSGEDLIGTWEMRFGGPVDSDKVIAVFEFKTDGTLIVGDELWRWRLNAKAHGCVWDDCRLASLSFFVPIAPMPDIPGLEKGTTQEEAYHIWKSADGRVILANFDASVIQFLTKIT